MQTKQMAQDTAVRAAGHADHRPTGDLACQVFRDWQSLEPLRQAWDECVARTGGDIYLTYDWCRVWWQYYGHGYEPCLLVFRQDEQVVGLLPMMIDRLWLGPVRLRIAKIVGSEWTPVLMTPPVAAEHATAIYARAIEHLLRQEQCDAVRFAPLAGEGPSRRQILQACEQIGPAACLVRDRELGVNAVIDLPASYEQYLAGLKSNYRSTIRRIRKKFESEYAPVAEVIDDPARIEAAFDEFYNLHQARWHEVGKAGHFGEFPQALPYNRDLLRTLAAQGRAWISRLRVNDQTIACEYNYVFNGVLYSRLAGRRTDEPWAHMSVARLSMLYLIEECMARGVHRIVLGTGGDQHKRELGATEAPVGSIVIAANRPWAAFKAGPLLRLRWRLVNTLYYHMWFDGWHQRPPLRLRRSLHHPLRGIWLRSRV